MSLDLAYLVLERCPLRGELFRALLILAIDADDDDWAYVSVDRMARWGRFTRARAQETLEILRDQGWIQRGRRPQRLVIRRRLMACPPVAGRGARIFAGRRRSEMDYRVAQVAENMRALHTFTG